MRIAIAGTGPLGALLMGPLLESEHRVVALLRNGRTATWAQRHVMPRLAAAFAPGLSPVGVARRNGIPMIYVDKMTEDELGPLRALEPDIILVGGFSIIFRKPLLDVPGVGCVNCHSSLLPKHRGPNPFAAAILTGERETGVTFHIMTEGIDSGPILAQYRLPIEETDTAGAVYRKTASLAGEHVLEVIDRIAAEGLAGEPQNEAEATYDKRLTDEEAFVRWDRPADEVYRFVRACTPITAARFRHRGRTVYISRAGYDLEPVDAEPGEIVRVRPHIHIATGRGVLKLQFCYTRRRMIMPWPGLGGRPQTGEKVT